MPRQKNRQLPKRQPRAGTRSVDGAYMPFTADDELWALVDLEVAKKPKTTKALMARNEGWPGVCIDLNAEKCSEAILKVYSNTSGDVTELPEHALVRLTSKSHMGLTWRDIIRLTIQHLELVGNAYWLMQRNVAGAPSVIMVLSPQHIKLVLDPVMGVTGYEYTVPRATKRVYTTDEIVHFRYTDPANPYSYGRGKMVEVADAADRLEAMDDYLLAFYDNNAVPPILITTEAGVPKEQRERFLEDWNQRYAGLRNAFKTGILEGNVKVEKLGSPTLDSGMFEAYDRALEEVFAGFGVPIQYFISRQYKAELSAADPVYLSKTIEPKLRLIEETINQKLLPMYPQTGGSVYVAYDAVAKDDEKLEADILTLYVKAGIVTPNEARAELGLKPLPDGDSLALPPRDSSPGSSTPDQTAQ
jgi:HK97 family phage portal protein